MKKEKYEQARRDLLNLRDADGLYDYIYSKKIEIIKSLARLQTTKEKSDLSQIQVRIVYLAKEYYLDGVLTLELLNNIEKARLEKFKIQLN